LLQAKRSEESLQEVEGTAQMFLEAEDEFRAAMAFGNLASALEANGELQGAEEALEDAIRIFKEIGDKEHLMHSARALSQLQLRRGRPIEAVSTMQGGLEQQSKISVKNRVLRSILSIPSKILGR
jgi:tetratricopeptide (TPR) repeat protein